MDAIARYFAAHADPRLFDGLFAPDCRSKVNGEVLEGPAAAATAAQDFARHVGPGRFEEMGRLEREKGIAVTWRFHPDAGGIVLQGATHFGLQGDTIHSLATRWLDL